MAEPLSNLSILSLIESGQIRAPATVRLDSHGTIIEASIQKDGTFLFRGENFASPSVAAGYAITATTGFTTPGRAYASVNGWRFWRIEGRDGRWRSLKSLRDEPSPGEVSSVE